MQIVCIVPINTPASPKSLMNSIENTKFSADSKKGTNLSSFQIPAASLNNTIDVFIILWKKFNTKTITTGNESRYSSPIHNVING